MYIITHSQYNHECPPYKAETLKEAKALLKEYTANNLRYYYGEEMEYSFHKDACDISNNKVIMWARNNILDFVFSEDESRIYYGEDGYSYVIMRIFNLDTI